MKNPVRAAEIGSKKATANIFVSQPNAFSCGCRVKKVSVKTVGRQMTSIVLRLPMVELDLVGEGEKE